MYFTDEMVRDVKRVKAMLKVVEDFANGEQFRCCDIPFEKRHNYYSEGRGWYKEEYSFGGGALTALVNRGFLEVVGTEEYIYHAKLWNGDIEKGVGERKIYRHTGATLEEYIETLCQLTFTLLMSKI